MEDRKRRCENCRRQVPCENYQMHVVHCKRNIQLCHLCGEAVMKSEEREHFEEYHEEIYCVQCGQKTTRSDEGNHLANECGKRPIPCQYCEITLPREKMPEHQEFCGSRTEFCHKCSRYILIKDLQNHEQSCAGSRASQTTALPCEFCGSLISPENLHTHQRQCLVESQDLQIPVLVECADGVFRDKTAARGNRDRTGRDGSERGNRDKIGSGGSAPAGERTSDRIYPSSVSHNSIVVLPCEICGELCPSDRLMEHQAECGQERESSADFTASGREEHLNELPHFRFPGGAYESSPYDILENVFRDLEERRWPFEVMRDLWSRT